MNVPGSFSQCLVEGDVEALGRARQLRRKALTASLSIESLVVVALLLVPLLSPGVLPKIYNVTPLPPYSGGHAPRAPQSPSSTPRTTITDSLHFPTAQSHPVTRNASADAASGPPDLGPSIPGTDGAETPGFGVDGGTGLSPVNPPPPSQPRSEAPRKVSIGAMEGSLIYRVTPEYPKIARNAHLTGEVKIRATIGTDGRIRNWEIVSGNPIFVPATIAAIRQWRYRPTLLNGDAVEVDTLITVNFVLD